MQEEPEGFAVFRRLPHRDRDLPRSGPRSDRLQPASGLL